MRYRVSGFHTGFFCWGPGGRGVMRNVIEEPGVQVLDILKDQNHHLANYCWGGGGGILGHPYPCMRV